MNLKQQHRHDETVAQQVASLGFADGDEAAGEQTGGAVERSVFCRHGLHRGHFPVRGLSVGEARRTLTQLLNIHPESVAVINGEVVDDDYVIGEEVTSLNFVKPSSIKG